MSYLRFTHDEYRLLAGPCRENALDGRSHLAFRRLVAESLRGVAPALADRVARLGKSKLALLFFHFCERQAPPTTKADFTAEEMQVLGEACIAAPFHVRFARPFRDVLAEMLQRGWPGLAEKVERLSGHQFEGLFERLCQSRRGSA